MQTLNFENGKALVSLDTLRRTASYELAKGGLPSTRPVEHHNFIDTISNIVSDKIDGEVIVNKILVPERQAARVMYKGDPELCPVENYLVQRCISSVDIVMKDSPEYKLSLGINFNENGIELVYGTKVIVCSNMNIFGDYRISTYGSENKTQYSHILDLVQHWASNYRQKFDSDMATISTLKNNAVDNRRFNEIIGKLINLAEINVNKRMGSPMNVTQVLRLIHESRRSETNPMPDSFIDGNTNISMWDITQWGTAVLKPEMNDTVTLYSHNHKFNSFILDECRSQIKHIDFDEAILV